MAFFPTCVVSIICLAVCDVTALSDRPVFDKQVGAPEVNLETRNERISIQEAQVFSKDADIATKVEQFESVERHVKITGERASQMLATIQEHGPQWGAAEVARSRAINALQ